MQDADHDQTPVRAVRGFGEVLEEVDVDRAVARPFEVLPHLVDDDEDAPVDADVRLAAEAFDHVAASGVLGSGPLRPRLARRGGYGASDRFAQVGDRIAAAPRQDHG